MRDRISELQRAQGHRGAVRASCKVLSRLLAEIRKNIHVLKEPYDEKGVCLTIKATPGTLAALKRRLAESTPVAQ